eukprot:SAG31_NODE_5174_length_2700_cov_2.550942_2_plen_87_part_00
MTWQLVKEMFENIGKVEFTEIITSVSDMHFLLLVFIPPLILSTVKDAHSDVMINCCAEQRVMRGGRDDVNGGLGQKGCHHVQGRRR